MLAVLLGYLALIILELIGGALLAGIYRGHTGGQLILGGEIVTFIAGILAGAITARMAPSRPLAHATVLGFTILTVTCIVTAISHPPAGAIYPSWYPYAAAALSGVGAFTGGAISGRERETPPED